MSAVETLREASRAMRERAQVWMGGHLRWDVEPTYSGNYDIVADSTIHGPTHVVSCDSRNVARHIAALDPTVALAIADWLEAEAARWSPLWATALTFGGEPMFEISPAALAVARAYLRMGDTHGE